VSTTELRVERGRAAVLTKTNDASGQMTGGCSRRWRGGSRGRARLQAAPFITPFDNHAGPEPAAVGSHAPGYAPSWYGTVSQTAWLLSKSEACVWVAYRETARPRGDMTHGAGGTEPAAVGEHGPWRWQRVPLPRT